MSMNKQPLKTISLKQRHSKAMSVKKSINDRKIRASMSHQDINSLEKPDQQ